MNPVGTHGSSSLLFMMKLMVWHLWAILSLSPKVITVEEISLHFHIYIYICSANSLYVLFTWLAWHLNPGESTWFFSKTPICETWEWDFYWRSINEWSMVMVFRSQDFAEVGSVATWYIRLVSPTKGWLLEWAVFYYNNNNNNIHLFIIYLFWVFLSLSSVAVSGLNYCYIIISNSCELLISYSQVEY
jgi:hypothetical protein